MHGLCDNEQQDQAYDRAHRFGQTRDVNIYKLMIPDTVETRILQVSMWLAHCILPPLLISIVWHTANVLAPQQLQDAKRELAKAALSGDKLKNTKLGLDDLLALFKGGGRHDDDDDDDDD